MFVTDVNAKTKPKWLSLSYCFGRAWREHNTPQREKQHEKTQVTIDFQNVITKSTFNYIQIQDNGTDLQGKKLLKVVSPLIPQTQDV